MPQIIVTPGDTPGRPVPGGGSGESTAVSGRNLRESNNVTLRPNVLTSAHLYNLRNQSWAVPRLVYVGSDTQIEDPIKSFNFYTNQPNSSSGHWPSNADVVNPSLYTNPNSNASKNLIRFDAQNTVRNPYSNSQAANGYFIIDALERGQSRQAGEQQLATQFPQITYRVGTMPQDATPGGASVVCEYAGRIFYAGFSGEVSGPDANSPRMSSYVLFSQVVSDISSITNCYQVADPTNKDDSTLVDSDGGFIRIEGAFGIVGLVNLGSNIAVIASNGVWFITGGNNYGFSATNYKVTKITNNGCYSPGSIVAVENTLFFFGADGIYQLGPNQFGDYIATNLTPNTIWKYYNSIDPLDIQKAEGVYDSFDKKIRWVYGQRTSTNSVNKELVFDLNLKAFYPSVISKIANGRYPMVAKGILTDPFKIDTGNDNVTVIGDLVTALGDQVVVPSSATNAEKQVREVKYLIITGATPNIQYSFGTYNQHDHIDWLSVDGVGVDANAYILTGVLSGGDYQRNKDVPYVTFYFRKTEDGFVDDGSGDFTPTNSSSCLVSPQWSWSNSVHSNKWGRKFQAYKFNRHYFPQDISDQFDNGFYVVSSRSKLRGGGPVLSLLIESEPQKHMELLGWSMVMENNNDV